MFGTKVGNKNLDVPLDGRRVGEDLAADVAGPALLGRVDLHLVTSERNVAGVFKLFKMTCPFAYRVKKLPSGLS